MFQIPESRILVNSREIREATPIRLWRKNKQAALLEFRIPRKFFAHRQDVEYEFRQGSQVELFYGLGTAQQRVFFGYLPSTLSDIALNENDSSIAIVANDFIGQLQDHYITLGDSTGSFLNPEGDEIGSFVATLLQRVLDSQFATLDIRNGGIQGTSPTQTISSGDAKLGTETVNSFINRYTSIAYDDSTYPDPPLLYEYHMRDNHFIWRKERALTSIPAMRLTIGKDAILSGSISRQPLYTDALVSTAIKEQWTQADRDASRRWGGRRFVAKDATSSSYLSDAYAKAVRLVELYKSERRSFHLDIARDAFLLYPGDIVSLDGGASYGIPDGPQRISEVRITLSPTIRASITVGDSPKVLTDYL